MRGSRDLPCQPISVGALFSVVNTQTPCSDGVMERACVMENNACLNITRQKLLKSVSFILRLHRSRTYASQPGMME